MANGNNQDPSRSYDAAGHLLSDGVHSYTYDAEGRISTVDNSTQYYYDGEGIRFASGIVGQTPNADFLYDLGGNLVTTVGSNYLLTRTSLYVAGHHWADYTAGTGTGGGRTEYRLVDQVGTLDYKFDQSGNLIEQCTSWPFGENLSCSQGIDFTEAHFTGKERDAESGLDYFGARYYGVTNAGAAPIPNNPGLAYGWGNNAQGYKTLGAASKAVNYGTAAAVALYGGAFLAPEIAAGGSAALARGRALSYAAAGLLPAVPSAIEKLQKLGISISEANELIESPGTQRLVDNANSGNINYIADVGGKLVRITTDPNGQRIISAGIVRANQIAIGISNGRFTR